MHIALFVSELDICGGTHKQVLRLAQTLVAAGHRLSIVTPVHAPASTYPEFAALSVLALRAQAATGRWRRLQRLLDPWRLAWRLPRVDVLQLHDNRAIHFALAATVLGRARAWAWQVNDLDPAFRQGAHRALGPAGWRAALQRQANRWLAWRVDAITVNVGKNRERVRAHLGRDAQVLHCGVDFPAAATGRVLPRPDRFAVLSAGAFSPYRNYEALIGACARLTASVPQAVSLTIVGDARYHPDYAGAMVALAQARGVTLQVLSNLDQPAFEACMAGHDVFAFVNVDQSWGLAVFEAAARALPVVLSRSVGACELLADQPGFLLVDPLSEEDIARQLRALAGDPQQAVRLGEAARRTVAAMSWEQLYGRPMELLFRRLLARSAP